MSGRRVQMLGMRGESFSLHGFGGQRRGRGGQLCSGHPKSARPLSRKSLVALSLYSSSAQGVFSLALRARWINSVARRVGQRFDVRVFEIANQGTHLTMILQLKSRKSYCAFVRSFCGLVARKVTGRNRNRVGALLNNSGARFWNARPFSCVLQKNAQVRSIRDWVLSHSCIGEPVSSSRFDHGEVWDWPPWKLEREMAKLEKLESGPSPLGFVVAEA